MLNGPTEAEALGAAIYLATFFLGASFWKTQITYTNITLTYGECLVYSTAIGATLTLFQSLYTGIHLAQQKNISMFKSLSQMIPFAVAWISGFCWWWFDPSAFEIHPVFFIVGLNLLFSFLVVIFFIQKILNFFFF